MTLNEIIEWAKENKIDFDKLVLVPYAGAIDIKELRQGSHGGLIIEIF